MICDILNKDGSTRCSQCEIVVGRYRSNGNIVLSAFLTKDSELALMPDEPVMPEEPWGTLTVNTGEPLPDTLVAVKDYSEGEGNMATLVKAGIIEETPVKTVQSGFVEIPICRLTEKGLELVKEMT